jgi:hypothetical protein
MSFFVVRRVTFSTLARCRRPQEELNPTAVTSTESIVKADNDNDDSFTKICIGTILLNLVRFQD